MLQRLFSAQDDSFSNGGTQLYADLSVSGGTVARDSMAIATAGLRVIAGFPEFRLFGHLGSGATYLKGKWSVPFLLDMGIGF